MVTVKERLTSLLPDGGDTGEDGMGMWHYRHNPFSLLHSQVKSYLREIIMKYFLTGATGFLGNVLARQLRAAGHEVHASVRDSAKASDLQSLGVKLFEGDVTEKESMRKAIQGVDGTFHVAGWYKIGTRAKTSGEKV